MVSRILARFKAVSPNPIRIFAGVFYIITGFASLLIPGIWHAADIVRLITTFGLSEGFIFTLKAFQVFLVVVALPVISITFGVSLFLTNRSRTSLVLAFGIFASTVIFGSALHIIDPISWGFDSWQYDFYSFTPGFGWATLLCFVVATVLGAVSNLAKPTSTVILNSSLDENSGQLPAQSDPAGVTPSNLPILALVGSFVIPLAGVILGHMAISQMNRGEISSSNRNLAKAGLIVGYVFTGIGFLTAIMLIIGLASIGYLPHF